MYYVGLDVHKKTISYCVKDGSGMASTEIRERRRTPRYRNLLVRQAVQMKNKMAVLPMEAGVNYNKQKAAVLNFGERHVPAATFVPRVQRGSIPGPPGASLWPFINPHFG